MLKKAQVLSVASMGAALLAGILLSACSHEEASASVASPFRPTASIQDIMLSIIDPNIDYVWNSVSTIVTAQGTEEKRPHTDEEWKVLRQHALVVAEASNLLLIEGRLVAADGTSTSSHPVELSPGQVQETIAEHRADFVKHAHDLHDAVKLAIAAIDAKNVERLDLAGGVIDHACEECHKQFWYPNDKRPTSVPASVTH